MNEDIDIRCARALGWTRGEHTRTDGSRYTCAYWHDANGERAERAEDDRCMECHEEQAVFSPSTDPAAVPLLLHEVARRGREDDYTRALLDIVLPDHSTVLAFWKIMNATPAQHARAFLAVMEGANG